MLSSALVSLSTRQVGEVSLGVCLALVASSSDPRGRPVQLPAESPGSTSPRASESRTRPVLSRLELIPCLCPFSLASYPHQAAEAVSRRLADFAFVLRDYRFAASVYDSIRKDYAADKAYRYQAAANVSNHHPPPMTAIATDVLLFLSVLQEMFGLSIIMTTPPRTRLDVDPFLEQAVLTYSSRGTAQLDAMRSTLLYYEGYRTIGEWRSVGPALLRAAGDVSDPFMNLRQYGQILIASPFLCLSQVEEIPSAILLEQAALADLRLLKPAMRRYAFHLVMAAQRYEKCGQVCPLSSPYHV